MIDDDGEKQRAVYKRCVSSRLREKACGAKERFGSSLYFCAIGQSDESHYIFSLHSALSLARRKAHKTL